jgi:hypothetical protein
MTEQEFAQASADLDAEAGALRERLQDLEELVHGKLVDETERNIVRVAAIERQIREIVLRLCEIEREQIELRVAKALQ